MTNTDEAYLYELAQAVAAASIGARYIAPYLGRLDDAGSDGAEIIGRMAALIAGTGTEVLVASLRTPERIVDLGLRGVNAFTAKPSVLRAALTADASDSSDRVRGSNARCQRHVCRDRLSRQAG